MIWQGQKLIESIETIELIESAQSPSYLEDSTYYIPVGYDWL
jgi:hypothetical protein